jgi:hypothetical protein
MFRLKLSLPLAGLIVVLVAMLTAPALAAAPKTVAGTIADIFNDEEAGQAYVTITTSQGPFIIDCKHKGFDTPIAPGDYVKVSVSQVRTIQKKPVGNLVTVIQHTPAKR